MGFKEELKKWNDWDGASYALGIALGIFDKKTHPHMRDLKSVFWSSNPVGTALDACLRELAQADILLARGDFTQFKWNPAFRGSWEPPVTPLKSFVDGVFKDD